MNYTWASATDIGHIRETNEDSVFPEADGAAPGPIVIAVADGMGGAAAGEVASRLAIDAATQGDGTAIDRVARSNRTVLQAEADDATLAGMGTTLTLGIFHDNGRLEVGHVGDSRTYLLRGGELEQLTTDHTLVAEMVASGRITAAQAETHPRRHLLTRVVGMTDTRAEVVERQLEDGDRVLFCSDGLTGMVSDTGIKRLLEAAVDPSEAAWSLVEAANGAGGIDNVTAAVVDTAK